MAPSFGRSISFPLSPARTSRARAAAYHVRSASLPGHNHNYSSHPLLAHLSSHIAAIRSWAAASPAVASPATGLAHLAALHAALADLLLLPEAQSALASSASSGGLLDAFLLLADAHQGFQDALLELKAHAADAQAALRRRDAPRLAAALRSTRRADKDLARLAASARAAACTKSPSSNGTEVAGAIADSVLAAAHASAAVFAAVESLSASATAVASKKSTASLSFMALVKRTKAASSPDADEEDREMAALENLEACAAEMESGSDAVFRAILRTRVALLNIQTQTCC
ncbi:hypothetical protein BRADI_1g30080v3 [Brachypodium distachyon]|uniref:Uncharacterized protein n=2 Tax=Brachypodium distachyon TaxID=15368 RepID=I1GVA4_BRADI|nr:hypothetical protein BRADI_1g30080v3 [Brachypodium distachyon]